ncbi:hypothetical protein BT93_I0054 [Corymbia citriodora subsp. variegata]|nr:hypothetical protein BT93_I0054 [Corymbia citriodora subsp. variegata]
MPAGSAASRPIVSLPPISTEPSPRPSIPASSDRIPPWISNSTAEISVHGAIRRGSSGDGPNRPGDLIMAETSIGHGAIRRRSSGDRPDRAKRNRPPPPPRPSSPGDLISDLPDDVIHRIFSFLPLEDVVKTSVLSKRWRSTWTTTTTHLVFDEVRESRSLDFQPFVDGVWIRVTSPTVKTFHITILQSDGVRESRSLDFPSFVDYVLIRVTSPTVKTFHITIFQSDEACRPKLDDWLRKAVERCVEDLRLCLLDSEQEVLYKLPPFLYCSSKLVRLQVSGCCLSLDTTAITWSCLKVLFIERAELSDDMLEGIVRGSPVLECIELNSCRGLKNIVIDSMSVKELRLEQGFELDESPDLEKIWAPHLQTLWLTGYWDLSNLEIIQAPHLQTLRLKGHWDINSELRLDLSSLVEAELDFEEVYDDDCCDLLKQFLDKLLGVSTITIGTQCLQILSTLEMEGVSSQLLESQNLIQRRPVSLQELPGIAYILRNARCLEKLVIT